MTAAVEACTSLFCNLCLSLNRAKSCLSPSRRACFLGAILDTNLSKASPSLGRQDKLMSMARMLGESLCLSVRRYRSLLGTISSCIPLIPHCSLRMRPLQEALYLQWKQVDGSFDDKIVITSPMRKGCPVVDKEELHFPRSILRIQPSSSSGDNRRFAGRLGRSLTGLTCQRTLVASTSPSSYQSPGTQGDSSGIESLSSETTGICSSGSHGQHHCNALPKQGREHKVSPSVTRSPEDLEMGDSTPDFSHSGASAWSIKRDGGLAQQDVVGQPRVGAKSGHLGGDLSSVGQASDRPFCHPGEQKMPVLRQQAAPSRIVGGSAFDRLVKRICIRFSPHSVDTPGAQKDQNRTLQDDLNSPGLAETVLVHGASPSLSGSPISTEVSPGPS